MFQRDVPSSTGPTTVDTEHSLTEQGWIQATKEKSFIENNLSWVITVPSLLLIAGIVVHVCKKKRNDRRRRQRKDNNPPDQEHALPLMPLQGMLELNNNLRWEALLYESA